MNQLDILLPFGLMPSEFGPDLLRVLQAPALATLLSRTQFGRGAFQTQIFDDFARALPHEIWSAESFGLGAGASANSVTNSIANSSPPIAPTLMRSFGLTPDSGFWLVVQPIHIHIASDHLVLTDLRQLDCSEAEARTLFEVAKSAFEQVGKALVYGDANTWFARADDWATLQTSTPDAVCGHSIDIWTPKGDGERNWRKLQNEVQMEWFAHPLNEARQARGQKPVNSIWLWGGASTAASPSTSQTASRYREVFNLPGWMTAYGQFANTRATACNAADVIAAAPRQGLLVLDALIEPALGGDWSYWLEHLHALEKDWFQPLLQALASGKLDRIKLIYSNSTQLNQAAASTYSLKKFWIKPTLKRLQP